MAECFAEREGAMDLPWLALKAELRLGTLPLSYSVFCYFFINQIDPFSRSKAIYKG